MRARLGRLVAAIGVVVAVAAGGSGTAAAAEPIVIGSCATTVQGAPGTPVQLSPSAVLAPVTNLVQALDPLNLITPGFRSAFAALPPIPIGAIPTGGSGYITGGDIANQVVNALRSIPLLGPIIGTLAGQVQQTLTAGCGVTTQALNQAAAPVQDGTKQIADASQQAAQSIPGLPQLGGGTTGQPGQTTKPGGGSTGQPGQASQPGQGSQTGANPSLPALGGFSSGGVDLYDTAPGANFGRVPLFNYGSLPFAVPGSYAPSPGVRYGGNVPGYAPQFGVLGGDSAQSDGVQTAGQAQALPAGSGHGGVAFPVLLAVLALSGVTAGLVRTWVLRRAAA